MKNIILFGCGPVAEKNLNLKPLFIVDNNIDMQGEVFHGIEVRSPSILDNNHDKYNIVICTTSVGEVKKQLESYGFTLNKNIYLAEGLEERLEISELEEIKFNFLISCGLPSTTKSFSGGGVFKVEETNGYPEVSKIYEGNTHGLIKYEDGYAFTCQGKGIIVLDKNLNEKQVIPLRQGLRPHGLRRYKDAWVLASSYTDSIIGIDDNGKELFQYKFSEKVESFGSAQHHCNDLDIVNDYAYVSMFSLTGNYKRNSFDGGVLEINLIDGKTKPLINTLTMPHSITNTESGFIILNSFKGSLLSNNFYPELVLPGFVRGYDSDATYHFIGESKNRNFSRLSTDRKPVSIDTKITIVNKKLGFSRSIQLLNPISEIHALVKL